jgi:Citrate synthase, C-terminal domain
VAYGLTSSQRGDVRLPKVSGAHQPRGGPSRGTHCGPGLHYRCRTPSSPGSPESAPTSCISNRRRDGSPSPHSGANAPVALEVRNRGRGRTSLQLRVLPSKWSCKCSPTPSGRDIAPRSSRTINATQYFDRPCPGPARRVGARRGGPSVAGRRRPSLGRARIIKQVADDVFAVTKPNPLLAVALELERIALADDYFVTRRLYPNVDFYSGLVYQAMGLPVDMFPVLFAIPRTAGRLAQWLEMMADPEQKIARPRQLYLGAPRRDYVPVDRRG